MNEVVCIGSACKDIFFPTGEGQVIETPEDLLAQRKIVFELGAKYKVKERHETMGGCAANVAAGLSKLGLNAKSYSTVGSDETGKWILEQMIKIGIDISIVEIVEGTSDLSAIIVDEKTGDRIIFSNQTANGHFKFDGEELKGAHWIFIGDLHGNWKKTLDKIFLSAKEHNCLCAYNPRQINIHEDPDKILESIKFCDVVFLNKDESIELITDKNQEIDNEKINDEFYLAVQLRSINKKIIVITDGVRGAWAYDGKNFLHSVALAVKAKETTGAGDSFASGFLGAYIKGKTLQECLHWGAANSASVVEYYGGVAGLLKEDEILKVIENISK